MEFRSSKNNSKEDEVKKEDVKLVVGTQYLSTMSREYEVFRGISGTR